MSNKEEIVVLPSSGKEVVLPELSTEQVLQLIRLAKSVLRKVPDLLQTVEEARLDYLKDQAQGFVSKKHYEELSDEEREALDVKLNDDFSSNWTFYEELSVSDKEELKGLGITEESLEENPIQFSFPSEVPMVATLARVFPDIYDACSQEIIMACSIVLMDKGRLEKAVKTNTVEAQLLDYRTELTTKLKPKDFIHLAAQTVSYVLAELRDLGGELGKVLSNIQTQLASLAEQQQDNKNEPNETTSSKTLETSEPDLFSTSPEETTE